MNEKKAREFRIQKSIEDLKNNASGQKTLLRLEGAPVITSNLNKDKGIVFGFGDHNQDKVKQIKLLGDAMKMRNTDMECTRGELERISSDGMGFEDCSTSFSIDHSEASTSGTSSK